MEVADVGDDVLGVSKGMIAGMFTGMFVGLPVVGVKVGVSTVGVVDVHDERRGTKKGNDNQHIVGGKVGLETWSGCGRFHKLPKLCLKKLKTTFCVHSKAGNKTLCLFKNNRKQKSVSPETKTVSGQVAFNKRKQNSVCS